MTIPCTYTQPIPCKACDINPKHTLGKYSLIADPLKRTKQITNLDGSTQNVILKLCRTCYQKARADNQTFEGKTCDIDPKHTLGASLTADPLQRTKKITHSDGTTDDVILKLCKVCYKKAIADKQTLEGKTCDIDPKHMSRTHGLTADPLKRTKKITHLDGTTDDVTLKLCHTCYLKAIADKSLTEGRTCDIDSTHKLGGKPVKTDPLKRIKKITQSDGIIDDVTLKLCHTCYCKALSEKQKNEGNTCDIDPTHKLGGSGVKIDPLKRTRKITQSDGIIDDVTLKLCHTCYCKALSEKQKNEGNTCDIDSTHKLGGNGLITDPLKRTKTIDGSTEIVVFKLCTSCYHKARHEKNKKLSTISSNSTHVHTSSAKDVEAASPLEMLPADDAQKIIRVKQESDEPKKEYEGIESLQACFKPRAIDNSLPILQDPQDRHKSLLLPSEGAIDTIICSSWGFISSKLTKSEKQSITAQVRKWLHLNESDREGYQKQLESFFEVSIPIDEGPSRGASVFAKKDIPQWTVVGPYAGVLHSSPASLDAAIRQQGSYKTLSYLFATRSSQRAIDAYATGNVTSLANTGQLPGTPEWAENNLASVLFGKNLTFYVSLKPIKRGEEMLVDYGPNYDPLHGLKAVKEEPN